MEDKERNERSMMFAEEELRYSTYATEKKRVEGRARERKIY